MANVAVAQDRLGFADASSTFRNLTKTSSLQGIGFWIPGKEEDKTITGSKYLFQNFEGLHVITNKAGNSFSVLNLNYNLKAGTLETKISLDSVFQYDLKVIDYISYANKKYKNVQNTALNGIVQEIHKGKSVDIYKKLEVTLLEGNINPMTQEKTQQDQYVQVPSYFADLNGNIDKIKLNKSAILKLIKDKQTEVKEYAKNNKLEFSNEVDVDVILKYYETL